MNLHDTLQARQELDLARAALAAGQLDSALVHANHAAKTQPDHRAARLLQARIHLARHEATEALAALDNYDLITPTPGSVPGHLSSKLEIRHREMPFAGETNQKSEILPTPDQPAITMLRAIALLLARQDELAQPLLKKLADQFPDDTRPHEMLAGLAIRRGELALAIQHLRELVRLRPQSSEDRQTLAKLIEEDDPQAAVALLEATPPARIDVTLQLWLADLYQRTGRAADAEKALAGLLKPQSTPIPDAGLWRQAGVLADQVGANRLAVRRLTRALAIKGRHGTQSLHDLALVHLHAGRFAAAGWCYWRAAHRDRGDSRAWAGLAICSLAINRPRLADRARHVLTIHADKSERLCLMAELWQHVAVGSAIRQAIAINPAPATAATASASGEPQKSPATPSPLQSLLGRAVTALENHTREVPNRADTQFHLGQCLVALGQTQAAQTATQNALAINPRYAAAAALDARLRYGKPQAA